MPQASSEKPPPSGGGVITRTNLDDTLTARLESIHGTWTMTKEEEPR